MTSKLYHCAQCADWPDWLNLKSVTVVTNRLRDSWGLASFLGCPAGRGVQAGAKLELTACCSRSLGCDRELVTRLAFTGTCLQLRRGAARVRGRRDTSPVHLQLNKYFRVVDFDELGKSNCDLIRIAFLQQPLH